MKTGNPGGTLQGWDHTRAGIGLPILETHTETHPPTHPSILSPTHSPIHSITYSFTHPSKLQLPHLKKIIILTPTVHLL